MTLEEQIQVVSADINEIKRLIDYTTSARIKQHLELEQRKFEKELIQLQQKHQQQLQQQAAIQAKETAAATVTPLAASGSYTKDISVYAWDQSDKFVKIYVQNLNGVEKLNENQIQCSFENRGFHLQIQNLNNINYSLKKIGLLHDIQPDQSTFKVKKDMVILSLRKVESTKWEHLLKDEKKSPLKSLPKFDASKDSSESILNKVEEMYENGDDDTKRAIAKAWVQSREKANSLATESSDKKSFDVLRTPEFTLYPPQ